jgi:hypothetical protein
MLIVLLDTIIRCQMICCLWCVLLLFEAVTAPIIKLCIFLDITQWSSLKINLRFGGNYRLHLQSWKVSVKTAIKTLRYDFPKRQFFQWTKLHVRSADNLVNYYKPIISDSTLHCNIYGIQVLVWKKKHCCKISCKLYAQKLIIPDWAVTYTWHFFNYWRQV